MLTKLMKYENRYLARTLAPLYLAVVMVSGLDRLSIMFLTDGSKFASIISGLLIFLNVIGIIAIAACTLILIIVRFYKNLLGDEGYLMNTLPVSTNQLILSKVLASLLWVIASMIVCGFSIFLLLVKQDFMVQVSQVWQQFWISFRAYAPGTNGVMLIIGYIALFLLGICSNILLLYTAASMGQTLIKTHRVLGGFVSYLIITSILQVFSMVMAFSIPTPVFFRSYSTPLASMNAFLFWMLLFVAILIAVFWALTHFFMAKKLNLE